MAASYPSGFDTMPDPSSNLSGPPLHSTIHNTINDVIEAIEAELGLSPSGTDATVAALLARLPRGYVTKAVSSSVTSGITTDVDVMTVTFTGIAGRRYRISYLMLGNLLTTPAIVFAKITDNTPTQIAVDQSNKAVGLFSCYTFVEVAAVGSVTYRGRISCNAGTITLAGGASQQHYLLVEDIGV